MTVYGKILEKVSESTDPDKLIKEIEDMGFDELYLEYTFGAEDFSEEPENAEILEKDLKFLKSLGIRKVKAVHEPEGGITDEESEDILNDTGKVYKSDIGFKFVYDKKEKLIGMDQQGYPGFITIWKWN